VDVTPGNSAKARAAERGLRQVLLREGRRQEPHEVNVKISSIGWPIARPPHERTPRRLRQLKNEAERVLMIDYSRI
jgi:hypothetical protein